MKTLKNWRSVVVIIVSVLMLTGIDSFAQRGAGQGYGRGFRNSPGFGSGNGQRDGSAMCGRLDAALDLTDEQEGNIEKIFLDFQKATLPARNAISENRAKLHTLMTSDNPDQKAIDELADKMGELRTSIQKARIDTHFKVRDQLTDEQKIKFDTGLSGRFGRGGGTFGYRGMHGRGWK